MQLYQQKMSSITIATKIGFIFRDDKHMASMRIVQFPRSPTLFVQLRPIFIHPLDLGRPIPNEPPLPLSLSLSSNDNKSIKRKHNPRMTMICYQVFPSGRLFFSINPLIFSGFPLTSFHSVEANLVPTAI